MFLSLCHCGPLSLCLSFIKNALLNDLRENDTFCKINTASLLLNISLSNLQGPSCIDKYEDLQMAGICHKNIDFIGKTKSAVYFSTGTQTGSLLQSV